MQKNISRTSFEWDLYKESLNIQKHGVDFTTAAYAFKDSDRKIFVDENHNQNEPRLFCIARVNGRILTVRFVYRQGIIRIIGAGYWRKGAKYYDQEKN